MVSHGPMAMKCGPECKTMPGEGVISKSSRSMLKLKLMKALEETIIDSIPQDLVQLKKDSSKIIPPL